MQAAADEVNSSCANGEPECSYTATTPAQVFAQPQSKWEALGSGEPNCDSPDGKTYEYDKGWTYSWNNSLGGKINVKGGIKKVFEVAVEVTYSHSWAESQSNTEKHTQKIPYHKVGFFYLQAGVIEFKGDFRVVKADSVDVIKNLIVDWPVKDRFEMTGFPTVYNGIVWPVQVNVPNGNCPSGLMAPPSGGPPPGSVIGAAQYP